MFEELLATTEAARRLGISRASLDDWLQQSNAGQFVLCGQHVTIEYLQGGAKGQGWIQIPAREIERLCDLMRVRPLSSPPRRPAIHQVQYPGITVKLGRPIA
jgi:hypothetical protein